MVAFTHLIVLATAGFSAVSAMAISKRDLSTDVTNIQAAISELQTDLTNLNAQDSNTATTLTAGFNNLIQVIQNSAISEEGQPPLSSIPELFDGLLDALNGLITTMENEASTIQSISGLSGTVQNQVGTMESVIAAYVNTVIDILPDQAKNAAVAALFEILASIDELESSLAGDAPPPSCPSS